MVVHTSRGDAVGRGNIDQSCAVSLAHFDMPRVLSLAGAARLGISESRIRTEVRRGNWRRLWTGHVLTRPETPQRDDLAQLGVSLGGAGSAVSGWDAARFYGLSTDQRDPGPVLVITTHGRNREVAGVRLRRSRRPVQARRASASASSLTGLPVVSAARAAADAALQCSDLATARAVLTAAVQRQLATPDELALEYAVSPRNGSYFLRRAVEDVLNGARSVAEADAIHALVEGRVPAFEVNVPICDPRGRIRYVVDVLWRTLRAVLEIDSRQHHSSEADWLATMRRHNVLASCGFAVVHWAPTDIRADPASFAADVKMWLDARARELGVRLPDGFGPLRPVTGCSTEPCDLTNR